MRMLLASALLASCMAPFVWAEEPFFVLPPELRRFNFELPEVPRLPSGRVEDDWIAASKSAETAAATWERLAIQFFLLELFERSIAAADLLEQQGEMTQAAQIVQVLSLEALGRYEEALTIWYDLQQQHPEDGEPGGRIALGWLSLDRPNRAVQQLVWHLQRHPRDARSAHLLAALYYRAGAPDRAWRILARTAGQAELSDNGLLFLCWLALNRGDPEEAIGWLRRVLDRNSHEIQQALVRLPELEGLQHTPLYLDLCDTYGLDPTAEIDFAVIQPLQRVEVVTVDGIRRPTVLPASLQVNIQLQADEEEESVPRLLGLRSSAPAAAPDDQGEIRLDFLRP